MATDLDGTFLGPDGRVSPRAAAAVRLARSRGIEVIPVTARAPWATLAIAAEAGMGPVAVCANGAVTYDLVAGEVIEHTPLTVEVALRVVASVREALPGVLFASENVESMVAERGLLDASEARVWGLDVCQLAPDVEAHLSRGASVTKLLCHHPDRPVESGESGESGEVALKLVVEACGALAEVTSAGAGWITIGTPGVTKAVGLAKVCGQLGLDGAQVVGVGDALNDVPMLSWVGQPLAVANACPEVLALAQRVLPSNAEDGVAELLESLAQP